MEILALIESAHCCDLKECSSCPSRERTACRERTMHELAVAVEHLQKENEILKGARKVNCIGCDWIHQDNGNCTAVGGFCTAVPAAYCPLIPKLISRAEAAEARAEKAERERDAAIKELDGVAAAVDELSDLIDEQVHPYTSYDVYLLLRENADAVSAWQYEAEWRGQKEE